ncbi:MAG TPA: phosphodiester glycosidase family protein [Polyangiaceae bacterium]
MPPILSRRRRKRLLWALGVCALVAPIGLWILVHRVSWAGPLVANTLRALIGTDNVTRLEELAYAIEDRINRSMRSGEKPRAYWQVPSGKPAAGPQPSAAPARPELAPFVPAVVGPVHESWSAPGDGEWIPISDPLKPERSAALYKTLLHPDRNRSWAEVFVVALDLRQLSIVPVPGTREPSPTEPVPEDYPRPGVIPEKHRDQVIAAFNGGFMTEHGQYGMKLGDVLLVKPRDQACTLAMFENQSLEIATFSSIKEREGKMAWYRQAPNCMVEDGKLHTLLDLENVRKWGATLDGNTVIRRSAVGLNARGDVLFVGISNHTTAQVMALGMRHAGASDVAQLDVNWSYPKFVTFERSDAGPERVAVALAEGFEFSPDEYIRKRSLRDFFYILWRAEPLELSVR